MSDTGHIEYVIEQRSGLRTLLIRLAFAATYLFLGTGVMALVSSLQVSLPLAAGLGLMTVGVLILTTWRYTRLEYEICLEQDTLTVAKIYGHRTRRVALSLAVKDLLLVGSMDDDRAVGRGQRYQLTKSWRAASAPDADGTWFAIWQLGKDAYGVLYFEPTAPLIRALRFRNPVAVTRDAGGREWSEGDAVKGNASRGDS